MEMKNTPKLRFPGFTDPWEQRKLGDVVKRESVTQVSSTEYPAIEYEDVIPETGQLNKDIYKKGVQKVGILFDANKVLYGKLRPYLHNWVAPMYTGVAVGDWWVLNPCGLDRGFLYTLIQTVKFDTIANQSAGSKMPRADWKLLSTTEFSIPSLDEQIKIGKLVEGLNDYITLHQRKLEHLKLKKKSLLQKLFPKEGEVYPELRFPGFTGPWEQCKLADVANIIMGQSPSSQNYTDNPNDDILVQGNADLIDGQVVPRLWTKEITKSIDEGNIIMTVRAPVGDVAKIAYKVVLGRGVAGIKGDEYIYQFLLKLKYNHYWRSLSSGSTFESINSNDIKNLIIDIPCDEERTKIGNLLRTTDSLINLYQRKLEHLKLLKKALLQQLFV